MNEALHLTARAARAAIATGTLRGSAFLDQLLAVPFLERDAWVNAVLEIDDLPEDAKDLPPESVPYLPCGVDEIVTMARDLPLIAEQVFVDLGSGLGRVSILAHLLSGARTAGLELQEHLVANANARCTALGLSDAVSFTVANVAEATGLEGTVFFLYAPFSGQMLRNTLKRLEEAARRRPIVICAVGLELNDVPWLSARKTSSVALTLYDSFTPGR
jgi:predicted RNA methylase